MIKIREFDFNKYLFRSEPDPDKRDEDYYYNNVASFYSEYINGSTLIGYNGGTTIDYLRAMSEGRNPQVIVQSDDSSSRKSAILDQNGNPIEYDPEIYPTINWSSGVWDVLSPANKIMNALYGTLSKIDYEVSADPMDYNTKHETEDNQLRRWAYTQDRKRIQFAAQVAGVQIPEPDFMPQSPEELDQYIEEFLPAHVRYIEQVVKHSFDISHWNPDTQMLFYRDLITRNIACVKNEYDPEDGKIKPVYIDIRNADTQVSKHMDCRDNERSWHYYLMSISQLRQYFPDKPDSWFQKVAKNYAGYFQNPDISIFDNYVIENPGIGWGYDSFKVCVGNFEWIDIDTEKQVIGKNKWGRETIEKVPLSSNIASDKTVRFKDTRTRLQTKWIIGEGKDGIFEYGPAEYVTYPSVNDTELTYRWINLPGKSIIEQLIPLLKNFPDLYDKYREMLRNAHGKTTMYDIDKLASTAGEKDVPQEAAKKAFRRLLATDKFLYRRVNNIGAPDNTPPLAEAEGGMGVFFTEIITAIRFNVEQVEYISGINPITLGQQPDPNAPVTTTQMAVGATNNTIRNLAVGYMRMKQGIAENLARGIVVRVRGDKYSRIAYEQVIGREGIQALISANKSEAEYGIKLIPRPTDTEKQWLLQNLQAATNPQQGSREISTADANAILNMIMSNTPVKTVQFFFEKARQRQRNIEMQSKMALMQEQSQLNQQDAQSSTQARMAENAQKQKFTMEQIDEKNQGTIANTAIQERLRKEKEESVEEIKTKPKPATL